jgi:hypothetical protein
MRIISLAVAAAFTVLSAVAFAQTDAPKHTETAKGKLGAYPLPQIDDGSPGLDVAEKHLISRYHRSPPHPVGPMPY